MTQTTERLAKLHSQAVADYQRGLITRSQLMAIVHRLDRLSHHAR